MKEDVIYRLMIKIAHDNFSYIYKHPHIYNFIRHSIFFQKSKLVTISENILISSMRID